jgi:hypothetical protein
MKSLQNAIEDYIALRRSLGFKLDDMAADLTKFASFLEQKAAPYITTALALEWAMQSTDLPPSYWARRLGFVRVFARHWSATDPRTEIPPAGYSRFERAEPVPIFTPNRRFRGCWLLPKASHRPAGFGHGLIIAYSVCWQSVASGSARQSSWSGKMWIFTKECSPSAGPSSTRTV